MERAGESFNGTILPCRLRQFRYYYERGHGLASDHFLELAQSICESAGRQKIPEETSLRLHTLLSEIHYSRGAAASESNAAKACMMHYSTFLDIWLKLCKQPSGIVPNLHLAVAYNEKGNGYMMSEKYEDAKECYLDSKAAYQQLDGYKDVMASLPVVNLGLAHWLLGELDSASRVLIEGLAAREEEYGIDDNESFE